MHNRRFVHLSYPLRLSTSCRRRQNLLNERRSRSAAGATRGREPTARHGRIDHPHQSAHSSVQHLTSFGRLQQDRKMAPSRCRSAFRRGQDKEASDDTATCAIGHNRTCHRNSITRPPAAPKCHRAAQRASANSS